VTSFGLFVTLDALYVDGLVHITELGGEYYRFDEARQELRGERTGIRYAVGTRVRVQVSRVDLDGRKIDFRLVREGEGERLLARGRSAPERGAAQSLQEVRERARAARAATRGARAGTRGKPATGSGGAAAAKSRGAKSTSARKRR
jgi:ribonuclease R